jgi:HAD superfamily hydrolase (TIGR01549 family)
MADAAIIFDVDGVLLELTRAEEELFFQPFASRCDATELSRDWNSYKIRNDEEIVSEIVGRYGLPEIERDNIRSEYLILLQSKLQANEISSPSIAGAENLLREFAPHTQLGIATANFRDAAKLRLQHAKLWPYVSAHAYGADGGGPKHEILARALTTISTPRSHIIYVGDNLNDVEAGHKNGVHFIGFSQNPARLKSLAKAGAYHLSYNHQQTAVIIRSILAA